MLKGSFTRTWQEREENIIRDTCPAVCERDLSHEPGKREKGEYYQRRLPGCMLKGSFTRTWQEREENIIRDTCPAVCERDLSHEPGKREKGE